MQGERHRDFAPVGCIGDLPRPVGVGRVAVVGLRAVREAPRGGSSSRTVDLLCHDCPSAESWTTHSAPGLSCAGASTTRAMARFHSASNAGVLMSRKTLSGSEGMSCVVVKSLIRTVPSSGSGLILSGSPAVCQVIV